MATNPLDHLADVDEITIAYRRPDGSTGSTLIWTVHVGDDMFVRSMYGTRGGWYRRLRALPDGEVRDATHVHPVHAEHVEDAATLDEVTRAYRSKYGESPYLQSFLEAESVDATLRLAPR